MQAFKSLDWYGTGDKESYSEKGTNTSSDFSLSIISFLSAPARTDSMQNRFFAPRSQSTGFTDCPRLPGHELSQTKSAGEASKSAG